MNKNPDVTLILFSYNQEKYIDEALNGVLSQSYEPLEIIISDDCSRDNTFNVIKNRSDNYHGPHNILAIQNESNIGVVEHINKLMSIASGDIIIIAAGDDISSNNRVAVLVESFIRNPNIYAVCSNASYIDSSGELGGLYFKGNYGIYNKYEMAKQGISFVFGAALSWRREIFDKFGPLPTNVRNEDQIIPFRAALLGDVLVIPDVLVKYREHENNLSFWSKMKSGTIVECLKNRRLQINNLICNYQEWLKNVNEIGYNLSVKDLLTIQNSINKNIQILGQEDELLINKIYNRAKIYISIKSELNLKFTVLYAIIVISPKLYALMLKNKILIRNILAIGKKYNK